MIEESFYYEVVQLMGKVSGNVSDYPPVMMSSFGDSEIRRHSDHIEQGYFIFYVRTICL
jgi:hypothetical protein